MKRMFLSCRSGAFRAVVVLSLATLATQAQALSFDIPFSDQAIEGVLNTTVTVGAAVRMQGRSSGLVGKANNNPNVCDGAVGLQSCQGLFKRQDAPARALAAAPGLFGSNNDDGDLNYNKYDLTSAVAKVTQDISLKYGDFGFFAKTLFFYDQVNNNFTEFHPNQINPQNKATSGRISTTANVPIPGNFPLVIPGAQQRVYGAGQVVRNRRDGGTTLEQIGSHLQFLDTYVYGKLPLPFEKELSIKLGRQLVNWGESTLLAINSINQANPINANNFFRTGFLVEEVFTPVNMVFLSMQPLDNMTVETFYQLEWKPLEAPAVGSFLSNNDVVGTNNATRTATIDFGGGAESPYLQNGHGINYPLDNPLNGVTDTSTTIERLPDHDPRTGGQFGVSLKYYAEWLNNGTQLSLYFMNYHSRLPYASTFSTDASCARREGNARNNDAANPIDFLLDCPNLPVTGDTGNPVGRARSNAVPLDTAKLLIEYPEDIKLYGFSFNTTFGEISMQGEVAYRPNAPLQIAPADLVFAAFGPTLSRCHNYNCQGTTGATADNAQGFGSSDTNEAGCAASGLCDTFTLGIGHAPGSARSFPSFVIPYRGGVAGENAPTDRSKPYDANNPGYIRGFERFKTLQYNLGATSVLGATDRLPTILGADQVLLLFEVGATHVPGIPSLDQLQIAGPGVEPHASAGADGSGADGSRQACSVTPTGRPCVVGPDGTRFNPHQANLDNFATKFSWGYDIIALIRYESLLPGISLQPQIIIKQDISGIAPGPGENFIEGRKVFDVLLETRYKSALSLNLGYTWITGGGTNNLLADRDQMRAYAKYQF
jgi:hypothetical protein